MGHLLLNPWSEFWRIYIISIIIALVCIPTNSILAYIFLYILVSFCCFWIFGYRYSNWGEVEVYCGFYLDFLGVCWVWAPFHVSIGHLYIIHQKMPFFILSSFLTGLFYYFWVSYILASYSFSRCIVNNVNCYHYRHLSWKAIFTHFFFPLFKIL